MSKYHSQLIEIRRMCNDTFMCNYNFMPPVLRLEKDNHKQIYARIERDINHNIHSTDIAVYSIEPLIKDFVKNMKKCKITVTYEIDNKDKVIDTEFNTGERPKFYLHLEYKFMKPHRTKEQ